LKLFSPSAARRCIHLTPMRTGDNAGQISSDLHRLIACEAIDFELQVLGEEFAEKDRPTE
jgi:hypothetical protein